MTENRKAVLLFGFIGDNTAVKKIKCTLLHICKKYIESIFC